MTEKSEPHTEAERSVENTGRLLSINTETLPNDIRVIIEKTRDTITLKFEDILKESPSYTESKEEVAKPLETKKDDEVDEDEEEEKVEEEDEDEDDEEEEEEEEEEETEPPTMQERAQAFFKSNKASARTAAAAGALATLPAYWYGSGISSIGLGATGLSALALALPALGYFGAGKRESQKQAGAVAGAVGSLGILGTTSANLAGMATAASAVALPLGLAYVGRKIGKQYKRPVAGGFAGLGIGMAAAPAVAGALTAGGGLASAGAAALGIGSSLLIPATVAAGTYGVVKGGKWLYNRATGKHTKK